MPGTGTVLNDILNKLYTTAISMEDITCSEIRILIWDTQNGHHFFTVSHTIINFILATQINQTKEDLCKKKKKNRGKFS